MDKCTNCEGVGNISCNTCNGVGMMTCPACGGSGREISICPTCTNGKVADPRSFEDEPTLVCPDCHGEWQKDVGPCKACNETGKVICTTCEGRGHLICDLCHGTGSFDVEHIESMCRRFVNVAEEQDVLDDDCNHCLNVDKQLITPEMVAPIFNAANHGSNIASYVAAVLCDDFPEYAGEKDFWDYLTAATEAGDMIAQYMYTVANDEEWGEDEDDWTYLKKSAEQGFVPALEVLAAVYYGSDSEDRGKDLRKALECWKKIVSVRDDAAWNEKTIKMAELHVKYLPAIIDGDSHAMLELGKSLLALQPKAQERKNGPRTYIDIYHEGKRWQKEADGVNGVSDNAVDVKISREATVKKSETTSKLPKKRWKFVVLGLLFGFLGIHLAYAKRWLLLLLLWAGFIAGGIFYTGSVAEDSSEGAIRQIKQSEQAKSENDMIGGIGFGIWALLWIGGTLFIKKDGNGNVM